MSTGFSSNPVESSHQEKHTIISILCNNRFQPAQENISSSNRDLLDSNGEEQDPGDEFGLTASQRMLAACSGSLLTSLLVTPLDVVRVRLQAQQHTTDVTAAAVTHTSHSSTTTPLRVHKFPLPPIQFQSTFTRLPPELGVTACCREVFWMGGESELCIVSGSSTAPAPPSTSSTFTGACTIEEHSKKRLTGTWDGLVKIARHEGTSSLWRGLSPTLAMAVPANVIYFTGYDILKASPLSPFSGLSSTWAPFVAGSSARAIAATAISPLELFRTRLWASTTSIRSNTLSGEVGAFKETFLGLVDMVKTQGWTSLWRGLSLTLWRDVPFSGIYWLGVETIKSFLKKEREKHQRFKHLGHFHASKALHDRSSDATFTDSFIAGAVAGSVAAFLTTPFDVGKTRIQVSQISPSLSPPGPSALKAGYGNPTPRCYKSMPSFLYGIYRQEGVRGLWKGCVPRILKVAPACAIMISTYDVGKQWAAKINQRKKLHEN